MKCPYCAHTEDKVIDSRPNEDCSSIRRRRECTKCNKRFTTYEKIEHVPLIVVKKDKSREEFDANKMLSGLLRACEKRPISISTLENLVYDIENQILTSLTREIDSSTLGNIVMDRLKNIEDVAYVSFASVYRQFKDINAFVEELQKLQK